MMLKDAFISYGRADSKSFAQKLCDRLTQADLNIWFDFEDIPFGVDYQDEIDAGIGNSDNFLFLISPHSVNSPYCAKEVKLALAYNKRIIPLMHVETISHDTWKQRNPQGTEAEWQDYQDKGLHSSFPNLHPAIGRINWIFFREGIDDFDKSCANLLALLQQHTGYVRQHTQYLTQALEWDNNQRQETFLLANADIDPAKAWLKTRFTETLPPCLPSILHSEFITESVKQRDRGMTDVFLSYSEEDREVQQQVRLALARQGFTVWTNTTDIRTGVDFQDAIYSGIEKADTIVFLLSPYSLASTYCQDELTYGNTYNKRVIPVLIAPMDVETLPELFQSVQFIDGIGSKTIGSEDAGSEANTQDIGAVKVSDSAIAQLIRSLNDNADYYAQHKRLLVQALEWDRRDRPNDAVLRGQEFVSAEAWLELSKHLITNSSAHPSRLSSSNRQTNSPSRLTAHSASTALTVPTRLHQAFIEASAAQNRFFDAFISYGRADSLKFATRLYDQLVAAGLNVWFDQEDIPVGVDFQAQIDDGIERSHNFLFIIAPHSVHSPYCLKEIELALRCNKRIIPLMHVEEIDYDIWHQRFPHKPMSAWDEHKAQGKHSSYTALHPEIGKINWIFFREGKDDFDQSLTQLTQLMDQHESYVRQHTDLLMKALAWQRHKYAQAHMLVGEDRQNAETWLTRQFTDEQAPCHPTDLHCRLITESNKFANNGMTQVFLCFAEEDTEFKEQLRQTLRRQEATQPALSQALSNVQNKTIYNALIRAGIPVWTYATDIHTGEQTEIAIDRGIEGADTFIFLLTPHSIQAHHCLRELNYALSLNKRVIPVMVSTLVMEALPTDLQALQLIDLTHDTTVDPLLNALKQDTTYYRIHKQLLAIALKWQRQEQNSTLLLRGKTLKQYRSWLQLAEKRSRHLPTQVQKAFIDESSQQPPLLTVDVFIIYTPADYEFVQRLNDTLQIQGKRTWFDASISDSSIQDLDDLDIDQLENGIDQSENIIFVVSPNSIKDARCIEELNYAHQYNKRIIPVLSREVLSAQRPPVLESLGWLDFQASGDFLTQFGTLYRKLESDPQHIRPHTLLMVRSQEWQDADRDDSYLLRGKELQSAQTWLTQAATKTPAPNDLQREYIVASQALPFRKLKKRSIVLTSIASTLVVFGLRLTGLLQPLELFAYDIALKHKPDEPQDDRFLIVKVDEDSGRWLRDRMLDETYAPSIGTIPEAALATAITNLQALNPSIIGLDFYRDYKAAPEIKKIFANSDNLIGLCKAGADLTVEDTAIPGYAAPAEIPIDRVGFNDFATTSGNVLRRHLINQEKDPEFCHTDASFSLLLARKYLDKQQIPYTDPWNDNSWPMKVGDATVPDLSYPHAGGYADATNAGKNKLRGVQTLLNFRTYNKDADQFALSIPLKSVIQGEITADQVRDRIVVLGYFDESDRNTDFYSTPRGRLAGATIQAQSASQLISAALDHRPLIWWWPLHVEFGWVLGWSFVGGLVAWGIVRSGRLVMALGGLIFGLYGSCAIIIVFGSGWVPFIPPLLAGSCTSLVTIARNYQLRH